MGEKVIGVGLVGYGAQFAMGKHHAAQVRDTQGLALRGAFDIDPNRRTAAKDEQPDITVFESYEQLLADAAIELVVLITPHQTHAPLSIAASRAHKHVLTEKVMCLNTHEADEMISAAEEAGKMLSVYQNRRWDGDFLTVRKAIESGALGRVFQIESSVNGRWRPEGWRAVKAQGGGMLYDWGAHLSDQLVQLMKPAKAKTVFATFHNGVHGLDIESQTTVVVVFDGGASAQFDVGCISHLTRPRWLVRGEQASLRMEGWEDSLLKGEFDGIEAERTLPVEKSDWGAVYRNLSRHLLDGEELAAKPQEVRDSIAIIEAAFRSGETGASVAVRR